MASLCFTLAILRFVSEKLRSSDIVSLFFLFKFIGIGSKIIIFQDVLNAEQREIKDSRFGRPQMVPLDLEKMEKSRPSHSR